MASCQTHIRTPSFRPLFCAPVVLLGSLLAVTGAAQTPATDSPSAVPADVTPVGASSLPDAPSATFSRSNPESSALVAGLALPPEPQPQLATTPRPSPGTDPAQHIARKTTMTIPSDWHAQPLTASDKIHNGLRDIYSPENFAALFASAGYEHITNGEPNFGTDKGAFGERLGAAGIRETTQTVFTEVLLAPVLHEDPRFYVKGPGNSFIHRVTYAATRPLITRKDDGGSTVNGALLGGYALSAAVGTAYYPASNRNFRDVLSVYGGSIGGSALGYVINEFSQDVLRTLHLSHP